VVVAFYFIYSVERHVHWLAGGGRHAARLGGRVQLPGAGQLTGRG